MANDDNKTEQTGFLSAGQKEELSTIGNWLFKGWKIISDPVVVPAKYVGSLFKPKTPEELALKEEHRADKALDESIKKGEAAKKASEGPAKPSTGAALGAASVDLGLTMGTFGGYLALKLGTQLLPKGVVRTSVETALDAPKVLAAASVSSVKGAYDSATKPDCAAIEKTIDGITSTFLLPVNADGSPVKNGKIEVVNNTSLNDVFANHKNIESQYGVNIINLSLGQRFKDAVNEFKSADPASKGESLKDISAALIATTQTNAGIIGLGLAMMTVGPMAVEAVKKVADCFGVKGKVIGWVANIAGNGYVFLGGLGFMAYGVYCGLTEPKGFMGTIANSKELNGVLENSSTYQALIRQSNAAPTPATPSDSRLLQNDNKPSAEPELASAKRLNPAEAVALTSTAQVKPDDTLTLQAKKYENRFSPANLRSAPTNARSLDSSYSIA